MLQQPCVYDVFRYWLNQVTTAAWSWLVLWLCGSWPAQAVLGLWQLQLPRYRVQKVTMIAAAEPGNALCETVYSECCW